MNLVELELDETLADFEVQDWIDNVFSVQYPDVKARIKKGCSGLCHKKDEWHYVKDGEYPEVEKEVLVCLWGSYYIGYYSKNIEENNRWHFEEFSEESEQITAWMYLPELPKESK